MSYLQHRVRGLDFSVGRDIHWLIAAVFVATLVVMPVIAVVDLAFNPTENIWPHLVDTVLGYYLFNTVVLMLGVGISVFLTGVTTAWLVTMCRFPGRQYFEWLLLLPLAMPAYVIAYMYTDLLEYAGPVQSLIRDLFGFSSSRDYWFPEIRNLGGAIMLMGLVLYPYVFLLARAAFLEQSAAMLEASRILGRGPWKTFLYVSLPIARPSIAVGVALALMETLNDYGTVDFFAVRTLTAGIYDTWLGMGNLGGAAQIASLMLVFVLVLIGIERFGRRNLAYYQQGTHLLPLPTYTLTGVCRWIAIGACSLPVVAGFFIPLIVMSRYAIIYFNKSWTVDFRTYAFNSFFLSALAAIVALAIALLVAYARRLHRGSVTSVAARIASLGYAVPGAVLAIGVIIPFASLDNFIDSFMRKWFDVSTGLLLSGTIFALVFAYVVRFLAVAVGQVESSLSKVSPSMDMAARTLGYKPLEVLLKHHLPLIRGGMLTAALIVFVDSMKELPATLILRPFNFSTLATDVFQYASDELIGESALGSLTIVLVGLLPVILLSRTISGSRKAP
ncbi:MAG: iron ABC transporter permease [marine bacterium B5-7]|nr:MAG: iron ABC transporter permease [marine bacterium B5-7]